MIWGQMTSGLLIVDQVTSSKRITGKGVGGSIATNLLLEKIFKEGMPWIFVRQSPTGIECTIIIYCSVFNLNLFDKYQFTYCKSYIQYPVLKKKMLYPDCCLQRILSIKNTKWQPVN